VLVGLNLNGPELLPAPLIDLITITRDCLAKINCDKQYMQSRNYRWQIQELLNHSSLSALQITEVGIMLVLPLEIPPPGQPA
jgi:hypothetical protein